MLYLLEMLGCVLSYGGITAADIAACEADAQVDPFQPFSSAILTTVAVFLH
jgi:hypothetical protein